MSTSDVDLDASNFDDWLTETFAARGGFTVLVVLVAIEERMVTPLASTYFNVIGDEVAWSDIEAMFSGSGMDWSGASFFPLTVPAGGPVDDAKARIELGALETRVRQERLVLNDGAFFDRLGRRLMIEEMPAQ